MKTFQTTVSGWAMMFLVDLAGVPAHAAGALDFLDQCVEMRKNFTSEERAYVERVNATLADIDKLPVTPEFRDAWVKDKRTAARPFFDKYKAPDFAEGGVTDMDAAFTKWFDAQLAKQDQAAVNAAMADDMHAMMKEAQLKADAPTRATLDQTRSDLDSSCKEDVGNQVLRVALAPLGIVAGNFERAKREKNVVTQIIAATTGVSPDAIAHNGPLGGEHSAAREAVNAVVGGPNGAIRKGLSDVGHFFGIR